MQIKNISPEGQISTLDGTPEDLVKYQLLLNEHAMKFQIGQSVQNLVSMQSEVIAKRNSKKREGGKNANN